MRGVSRAAGDDFPENANAPRQSAAPVEPTETEFGADSASAYNVEPPPASEEPAVETPAAAADPDPNQNQNVYVPQPLTTRNGTRIRVVLTDQPWRSGAGALVLPCDASGWVGRLGQSFRSEYGMGADGSGQYDVRDRSGAVEGGHADAGSGGPGTAPARRAGVSRRRGVRHRVRRGDARQSRRREFRRGPTRGRCGCAPVRGPGDRPHRDPAHRHGRNRSRHPRISRRRSSAA